MNDIISRQAAIDVIKTSRCLVNALKKTMKLPSAQPERKTGHWEDVPHKSVEHGEVVVDGKTVRCSVCKCAEKGWNKGMNYCPNCGAKMEVNK